MLTPSIYRKLQEQNYTLVIAEVLTCCDHFTDMSKSDKDMLFGGGYVFIEEATSRLRWDHDKHPDYKGKFDQVKNLCDNGNLVVYVPKPKSGKATPSRAMGLQRGHQSILLRGYC
jgi:hypothetical protein